MTKREICERLMAIWEMEPYKNTAEAIKHLLLDIAAQDDHFADAGKMMREEEPPVLLYDERGEKVPCPVCGGPAYIIKNAPEIYCKRCARVYTREEGK